jgi:hypothetical protein
VGTIDEALSDVLSVETRSKYQLSRTRNSLMPTCRLPVEILVRIFAFCLPTFEEISQDQTSCALQPSVTSRMAFSYVCQRWREVALEHSVIWATPMFSNLPWAFEMIKRARDVPLDVVCRLVNGTAVETIDVIVDKLATIRHLDMCGDGPKFLRTLDRAEGRRAAPLLESLCLKNSDEMKMISFPADLFAGGAPRLQVLCMVRCTIDFHSPLFDNLKELSMDHRVLSLNTVVTLHQMLDLLRRTPRLTHLALRSVFLNYYHSRRGSIMDRQLDVTTISTDLRTRAISLRNLTSVKITNEDILYSGIFFGCIRAPSLLSSHLTGSLGGVVQLDKWDMLVESLASYEGLIGGRADLVIFRIPNGNWVELEIHAPDAANPHFQLGAYAGGLARDRSWVCHGFQAVIKHLPLAGTRKLVCNSTGSVSPTLPLWIEAMSALPSLEELCLDVNTARIALDAWRSQLLFARSEALPSLKVLQIVSTDLREVCADENETLGALLWTTLDLRRRIEGPLVLLRLASCEATGVALNQERLQSVVQGLQTC